MSAEKVYILSDEWSGYVKDMYRLTRWLSQWFLRNISYILAAQCGVFWSNGVCPGKT